MTPTDWILPDEHFRSPHDWRHFVIPVAIAVGINFSVLALWHWPIWNLSALRKQPLHVELRHREVAKPKGKTPNRLTHRVEPHQPSVQKLPPATPVESTPEPTLHSASRAEPGPVVTQSEQPALARKKLYDSAEQAIEAMSRAKEQRIPMGGEIPDVPRPFRHTNKPHPKLPPHLNSGGSRIFVTGDKCYVQPGPHPALGNLPFDWLPRRVECPWDKTGDEGFQLHLRPPDHIDPFNKRDPAAP
ncbi:MAG TPA: hypothetical protein VFK45_07070 [Gammaproteobacteria bacterium]|nr:hypothetical protein [Gammaproteobacteria bacterium]